MADGGLILVTGASGFVGTALVRRLRANGIASARLRCLARDPRSLARLDLPEASIVQGSLGDPRALARACAGVALTYHIAGAVKAISFAGYLASNTSGTEKLVAALDAHAAGSRLVHVSSLAAAAPSRDGATSALPPERCAPPSLYGESKRRGELAVVASRTLSWLVLRPPIIYGPGDGGSRFLFRQALAAICAVPWAPRPLSLMHIDDVVDALLLAGSSRVHGRFLPLDGPDRLDTNALMHALAASCGRRARLVRAPLWLARLAALPCEAWARVRARPSLFSLDKLREVGAAGWIADPAPARDALGFAARIATREGFARVARAEGWLAADAAPSPA